MRISSTKLRTAFVALAIVQSGIPAVLTQTTASQSVSLSDISKRVLPSILSLKTEDANGHAGIPGTGFVLGLGVIATDYRVVKDAVKIQAASPGEDALDLAIVAVDERRTVALLKIAPAAAGSGDQETKSLKRQKNAMLIWVQSVEQPAVGDLVYLFSNYAAAGGALLPGKIDELREEAGMRYFHLAGTFGPDSVGSPVLNAQGDLVGMVMANPNDGGGGPSFAIPADHIGGCGSEGIHITFAGGVPGGVPADSTKRSGSEATVTLAPSLVDSSSQVVRKAGGVLQGSALRRVQPIYPPLAKAARISGAVVVEVMVDEGGDVVSARAVSGHPLMKDCAAAAARGWKFTPTALSGSPVKVIGTITFNFTMGDESTGASDAAGSTGPSADRGSGGGDDANAAATDVDSRPILLNRPRPNYTDLARSNHIEGIVSLRALVGSDGLVKQIKILRGLPDGLNGEAVRSVQQIRFKPAMKNGEPVAYWLPLEIEFHLRK